MGHAINNIKKIETKVNINESMIKIICSKIARNEGIYSDNLIDLKRAIKEYENALTEWFENVDVSTLELAS